MKKFLSLILALGMVASLAGCGGSSSSGDASSDSSSDSTPAASAKLRFVTGGESGTYYAFGSVIAQHATNNAGVNVVGLVGNGSQANVMELQDGNAELAFCQSDVMAYAYAGTNLFAKDGAVDCFSTVAALYQETVQIVTCDPQIKTVADLKGKNVSIGSAGSGVYFNAIDVLGAYGLTEDDITPTYQSFGDSADALKDGKIDGEKGEYPYLLFNPHYFRRSHSVFDNCPWLREAWANPVFLNASDAKEKGIEDGDTVRVWTKYGEVLRKACCMENLMPGEVGIPHGSWVRLNEKTGIDEGGADNYLTGNNISGCGVTSYNNNNCNFEKYDGPALEDDCYTDARILNLG